MMLDASLNFVGIGGNLSLVAGAGINIPSSNVIDFLGSGVGTAPPVIIGTPTLFGTDMGIGDIKAQIQAIISTALATSNVATLNMAFQLAPDTAVTHQPGTWQTVVETGPITAAQGAANTVLRLDWPAAFPANENARYARLLFQVPAGTNFTAGVIASALVTTVRDDQANKYAAKNYVVG